MDERASRRVRCKTCPSLCLHHTDALAAAMVMRRQVYSVQEPQMEIMGVDNARAFGASTRVGRRLALQTVLTAAALFAAAGQAAAETSLNYDGLFDELRKYTQGGSSPHRGGVYDHSAWTAMAVCQWFQEKNFWTEGLDPKRDFNVAVIAAFMHDIGKADDLKYALGDGAGFKPEHPNTGYRYLAGKQSFEMAVGTRKFDFKMWQQKIGLSDDDYKSWPWYPGSTTNLAKRS